MPKMFDEWRSNYDGMTYQDQLEFYKVVATKYPSQVHFKPDIFREFFATIELKSMTVVETGGWRGELADTLLSDFPITQWTNYEVAELIPKCQDDRYKCVIPDDYVWNIDTLKADVFVSSHMIEHIRFEHLCLLFDNLEVDYIVIESPLSGDDVQKWKGYGGSHILEVGWESINRKLESLGFTMTFSNWDTRGWLKNA